MDFQYHKEGMVNTKIDENLRFQGERILVADDNDVNLRITQMIFEDVGLKVDTVVSGFEALKLYESCPAGTYRMILLDIDMHGMDGCDTAKAIRESGREDARKVPIYALSAYSTKQFIDKAKDSYMQGYMTKPINYPELFRVMKQEFERRQIRDAGRLPVKKRVVPELDQLDSHFIFNALNTIKAMTILKPEAAGDLIDDLAAVMRYRLRMVRAVELVPLQEELYQAQCFARLEMARYSKIQIVFSGGEDVQQVLIHGLTVTALVENAVRHGLRGKEQGGRIMVNVVRDGDEVVISVEDNGEGFAEPTRWLTMTGSVREKDSGVGLFSLSEIAGRLGKINGSLRVETGSGGSVVRMVLKV